MKHALKPPGTEEFFEVEFRQDTIVLRCLVTLDNWNIRQFKQVVGELAVFQHLTSLVLDFQSQPVDSEYFQVVVQAAQVLKILNKRVIAVNTTSEFMRAVAANGLASLIKIESEEAQTAGESASEVMDSFPRDTQIMIVDDIQSVRSLLRAFLAELGYDAITEARSGEEALRSLENASSTGKPIRLIISDWYMPGMTGLQLHRKVVENPALIGAAFILLTVETEKNNVLKAFQEGVKYYLVKPFRLETLAEKFREIWNKETFG